MNRLNVAIQAAKDAGEIVKEGFYADNKTYEIKNKNNHDIVTVYDKKAQEIIIKHIQNHFPYDAIIGEENNYSQSNESTAWVIDPIDGTFAFARKIPECCVVIGYMVKHHTQLCVIYDPIAEELFSCAKGQGVFLNNTKLKHFSRIQTNQSMIVVDKFPTRIKIGSMLREEGIHTRFEYSAFAMIRLIKNQCDAYIGTISAIWDRIHYIFLEELGLTVINERGGKYSADQNCCIAFDPAHQKKYKVICEKILKIKEVARAKVDIK